MGERSNREQELERLLNAAKDALQTIADEGPHCYQCARTYAKRRLAAIARGTKTANRGGE